jgi:hypothetical protein
MRWLIVRSGNSLGESDTKRMAVCNPGVEFVPWLT